MDIVLEGEFIPHWECQHQHVSGAADKLPLGGLAWRQSRVLFDHPVWT